MFPYRRLKTERVASYRIFDVLRHETIDGQGRPLREAFTFDFPDWAGVVPVTADGQFVLVRQYRHGIDGPTLEIPGGIVEEGHDPPTSAMRELREETGYGGGTLVSLGATR